MKAYPAYKDSGVEWIGNIPQDWDITKLKWLLKDKLKYGANESAELVDKTLPRYIRITDFDESGNIRENTFRSLPNEIAQDYLLDEGDILFARSGATVGKTFQFKNYKGKACFAGYLIKASPNTKKVLSDYLYLFTKSSSYEYWKNSIFIQATIQNIGANKYQYLDIPVPPLSKQRAIADFLNRKTTQIDTLITKKQRQIELLQEHRTAIINQAVNKGLNPDAPMKGSGVEWLGEIPGHWEVKKLKWLANVTLSNIDKKTKDDEPEVELCNYTDVYYYEHISQSIDFMRASASRHQIKRLSLQAGDVLITKDSETPDDIAVPAYVPETLPGVVCGYHLSNLRSYAKEMRGKYLFRSFQANDINDQFQFSAKGITRFGISKYIIENALFLQPPLHEQRAIADFLDHRTAIIDHNVTLTNKEINLLQEYRTALISATVTGKIDVRAEGS